MSKSPNLAVVRPKHPPRVLVCTKCMKKLDDGKAIRKAIKAELAHRANATGRRPGKLIETRCMGLCPKRAVTLASGASLMRGELLMMRHPADASEAIDALLG